MKWLIIFLVGTYDYSYINSIINPDEFNTLGLIVFLGSILFFVGYCIMTYVKYLRREKNVKLDNEIKKEELKQKKDQVEAKIKNVKKEGEDD